MRSSDGLPIVAIVGRPNVGKSTLFNRVIRRRQAVVHDQAGVTRDRNYARARVDEREFWLVDTGGFTLWDGQGIELAVQQQVDAAIEEADLVLLLLDARTGMTAEDEEVVRTLLRRRKPVVCAANKADSDATAVEAAAIVAGGLGEVVPVSAVGGRGIGELLERVAAALPSPAAVPRPADEDVVCVAIVGRPNVGKSSLVNAILGEPQMIVDERAGTTRDAVDTPVELEGVRYLLIDTAGLRRRARVKESVEYWSTLRSSQALRRSDVVVLVMDAMLPISGQDVHIAAEAVEELKSVIVVANKWDAVEKDPDIARRYEDRLKFHFKFLPDAPVLYVSAKTGRRVTRILPEAARLARTRAQRVPTARVNEVLRRLVAQNPPPSNRSSRITRIYYGSQVSARPPTFVVFTNQPENVEGHYVRFLRNHFKAELGFDGVPVQVLVRRREGKEDGE